MIAAVIFDLYGTLVEFPYDSRPFLRLARRSAGNVRSTLEVSLTTENPTLSDFATRIGLPPQDDLSALEGALQKDVAGIQPYSDVRATLTALKGQGTLTAVVSNLATPYKQPFVQDQLSELFDVTVFSCDCGYLKPDLRIYELALEQLGTSPSETMMIGDTFRADVEGPARIGVRGVHLVRSGETSEAECVVYSLTEILDFVPSRR